MQITTNTFSCFCAALIYSPLKGWTPPAEPLQSLRYSRSKSRVARTVGLAWAPSSPRPPEGTLRSSPAHPSIPSRIIPTFPAASTPPPRATTPKLGSTHAVLDHQVYVTITATFMISVFELQKKCKKYGLNQAKLPMYIQDLNTAAGEMKSTIG